MKVHVILYTMKGCDHCKNLKKTLRENKIAFIDRDVDKHGPEYEDLKKIVKSEYVPLFMIIEESEDYALPFFYIPGQDFENFQDAVTLIKKHQTKEHTTLPQHL